MALQEYVRIYDHGFGESILNPDGQPLFKTIDEDWFAALPAAKRAKLRPVLRTQATPDPLTQRLGDEQVTIEPALVTIHRPAVALDDPTRQAKVRAAAQSRIDAIPAQRRERVQMEMLRLMAGVTLGGTLTAPQTARLTKLRDWCGYWLQTAAHGEALAADPNLPVAWPAEPAGGAP